MTADDPTATAPSSDQDRITATAAQEVAHVTFNPTPLGLSSPLAAVCDDYERGGWRLVQVVPHHAYESVAVFVRGGSDGE